MTEAEYKQRHSVVIPDNMGGMRADTVLAPLLEISRSAAAMALKRGQVMWRANPETSVVKSTKLPAGAELDIRLDPERDLADFSHEPDTALDVLYEDRDLLFVDKPSGVAAHPSTGWLGPTVVGVLTRLGYQLAPVGEPERAGIVHRLDVGTSGVMVVAKTAFASGYLKRSFKERRVEKMYHAVVQGMPDLSRGTIDAPIGHHRGRTWRFVVAEDGKMARTHYTTLEAFGRASHLEISLETGRTHQIRVHMASIGHPCAGDLTYGADPRLAAELGLTRQWLHAKRLSFLHPRSGEHCVVDSEYPNDLDYALGVLRL